MKTSELTNAALDRAVGVALQLPASYWNEGKCAAFSTDWAFGGPIIEREKITISDYKNMWVAGYNSCPLSIGPTPLIAAMRCFIASRLGGEVEIPAELS